ncbi:hypothetical protein FB446DRAFT_822033 [Lentinula raphanica]|nr:hypothetical protein FB446DRAFT_822033 [Lentinula raphanica]
MYNVEVKNTFGPGVQASSQSVQEPSRVPCVWVLWVSGFSVLGGNTIGVLAKGGSITASARETDGSGSCSGTPSTVDGTNLLGRPWSNFAKVIFEPTILLIAPNATRWSLWDGEADSISNVLNADYNTTGPGAANLDRVSWGVELTSAEAREYDISSAVGSDWEDWVNMSHFV